MKIQISRAWEFPVRGIFLCFCAFLIKAHSIEELIELPDKIQSPEKFKKGRVQLAKDLGNAILFSIQFGDIQKIRNRIATGFERSYGKIKDDGDGSLPYISTEMAIIATGKIIFEIENAIRDFRTECETKGIDLATMQIKGDPLFSDDSLHRVQVFFDIEDNRKGNFRIECSVNFRKVSPSGHICILHGGGIFGGICINFLTKEEEKIIVLWQGKKSESALVAAKLILKHKLNYRFIIKKFSPVLLQQKLISLSSYQYDGYAYLSYEETKLLRREMAFAEPKKNDRTNFDDVYMKIFFDKNGLSEKIIFDGKEVDFKD